MGEVGTLAGVTEDPPAQPTERVPAQGAGAALGPVIALGVALSIGALFVVAPLLWRVMPITPLPAPFPDTHQDAETLIFIVTFALLVPAGIVSSTRLARRIAAGPNAASLSAVAALLMAGVAIVLVVTRISKELPWGGGPGVLAALGLLWWVLAAMILHRAASSRTWNLLTVATRRSRGLWRLNGALLAGVVLSFTDLGSVSVSVLAIGLAVGVATLALRERIHLPTPSRRAGAAIDAVTVVLLALAIPNLVVFVTGSHDFKTAYQTVIIQYHQDFFLGPANQILAGDAMLVNVLSQYGVGSIYFLAGVFLVIPIGNGTLGLIEGVLSALMFIGTFATLRIAGVSRFLAGAAMAFAVVVLVYGLEYPLGGLLQHGAIRFGLPVGVVVGAVAESRWPRAKVRTRGLQLLTLTVASIWALEAFAYTLLTVVAVAAFHVATRPAGRRRREARNWALQIGAAVLVGHLLLALATLGATGSLPDWGWYLHTLREFLAGTIGDWTYDFSSFSWGLLVGGGYVASGVALVTTMVRRPDLVRRQRTTMLAIAAMTAWGIALFSYLVNRSADHIIPYVCLPAVALGALWLSLLGRRDLGVSPRAKRAALAGALAFATLLVAVAWSSVPTRFSQSALAYAVPGGDSLAQGLDRLRDRPVILGGAVEGEKLLRRLMPGERRSIVVTAADLSIEILLRSGRASAVPFGDPIEDSFVPDGHYDGLRKFVGGLEVGQRVLLDKGARAMFDRYRSQPGLDPVPDFAPSALGSELAPLQRWVLRAIGRRFDLRTVIRTATGFEVVELVPRRDAG